MDNKLRTILKREVINYPVMSAAEQQRNTTELQVMSERAIKHILPEYFRK
jgi:hypothetical protein